MYLDTNMLYMPICRSIYNTIKCIVYVCFSFCAQFERLQMLYEHSRYR